MAKSKHGVKGSSSANVAGGGMSIGKILGILIALAIAAAGALFMFGPALAGNQQQSLQTFAQNGTVPSSYSSMFQNQGTAMSQLTSLINSSLEDNATAMFHVNYTGSVHLSPSKNSSMPVSISSPAYVWIAQYSGNRHLSLGITSAALFGSMNAQYLHVNDTDYVCSNFNTTALQNGKYAALVTKTSQCSKGNTLAGIDMEGISNFDFGEFDNFGMHFTFGKGYQSSYKGVPCTVIMGNITGSSSSGSFVMCMDDQYNVPLSFGMVLNGKGGSFSMFLNETDIGNSSSQSVVDALPYPLK